MRIRIGINLLLICCACSAGPREEVRRDFQKTLALPAGRNLRVENSLGNVNIRAQAKNEVTVVGAIRCSADTAAIARSWCDQVQIRVEENAAGITVRTDYPNHNNTRNLGWSVNLDIAAPEGAPLDVRNRFGGVTVQGARAGTVINNSNGNIYVANARGGQRVENRFGNVEVQNCDGDVAVNNSNGWVRATDVTGTSEIANRFGDVRVTNAAKNLTVRAGNSKVDVERAGGIVNVTTSFGDVRVWDAKNNVILNNQNGKVEAKMVTGTADLRTTFGSVTFSEIGKGVTVVGQNAEVTGNGVGESAAVQTTFANVDVRHVKGSARVTAGNSTVRLVDVAGEVFAKTTFGGVTVDGAGGPVTVEDANGSVAVTPNPSQSCKPIVVHTSFAPIRVTLPPGAKYNVTGKTSFGHIHSEHDLTVNGAIGTDEINGKIGGGGCELRLTGQNGDIDLLKR